MELLAGFLEDNRNLNHLYQTNDVKEFFERVHDSIYTLKQLAGVTVRPNVKIRSEDQYIQNLVNLLINKRRTTNGRVFFDLRMGVDCAMH